MPLAHVSLPVSDLPASRAFYLTVLKPLGYEVFGDYDASVGMGPKRGNPDFWLHKCPDEEKKSVEEKKEIQKTHVAFQASSRSVVEEFHKIALKAGSTSNGPPGERKYVKGYYAAYVLDPDGHNIEFVHWQPWWLTMIQTAPVVLGAVAVGAVSWWAGRQG